MDEGIEEVLDFISELHQRDRERAAWKEGFKEGKKAGFKEGQRIAFKMAKQEGMIDAIKIFQSNKPRSWNFSCKEIAAMFGVKKSWVRPLMPDADKE